MLGFICSLTMPPSSTANTTDMAVNDILGAIPWSIELFFGVFGVWYSLISLSILSFVSAFVLSEGCVHELDAVLDMIDESKVCLLQVTFVERRYRQWIR